MTRQFRPYNCSNLNSQSHSVNIKSNLRSHRNSTEKPENCDIKVRRTDGQTLLFSLLVDWDTPRHFACEHAGPAHGFKLAEFQAELTWRLLLVNPSVATQKVLCGAKIRTFSHTVTTMSAESTTVSFPDLSQPSGLTPAPSTHTHTHPTTTTHIFQCTVCQNLRKCLREDACGVCSLRHGRESMRDQARWCTRTISRLEIQTVCAWKHALMREREEKLSVAVRLRGSRWPT